VRRRVLILTVFLLGCAPKPAPSVHPDSEACRLFADAPQLLDSVTVVLSDTADVTNALSTLIRLDCRGNVQPGLARSWSKDAGGRTWTLILKDDERGFDGLPLTAHRIAATWAERGVAQASSIVESVVAVDERTVAVTLSQAQDSAPSILADPLFSVPVAAEQGQLRVEFQQLNREDPRDALDRGADILVTRDPSVPEYVTGRPEFVSFSLPWSRTYVLLEIGNHADSLFRLFTYPHAGRSLADAAGVDARPAQPPFWWSDLSACPRDRIGVFRRQLPHVVYAAGDDVARRMAERVVAFTPSAADVRALALEPAELRAALRSNSARAYVLAVPRRSLAPCRDSSGWPRAASIQPLIDSRAFVIVRRGSPPLAVDWDGTVRFQADEAP
jgi:hypothetical protein